MNDEWETPAWLFDQLNEEFHFVLDAAASEDNFKCSAYLSKELNALRIGWGMNLVIWLNPPYSNPYPWVKKAYIEAEDNTIVLLLPSTTGVKWFQEFVWDNRRHEPKFGVELRFLPGRIKFVGAKSTPRFDSVIVIFWQRHHE